MNRNRVNPLGEVTDEADAVILPYIDRAGAIPRPDNIGDFHSEREYHAKAQTQTETYTADGEATARKVTVTAAGLESAAIAATELITGAASSVEAAREQSTHAARTLGHLARRDLPAKVRYWICLMALCLGDTAGILGAAITLGEIPLVALGQAVATGVAAITAGQAGGDLKDLRLARIRRRNIEGLTDAEQRYRQFFTGAEAGVSTMKLVGALSGTIVAIISVGIFCLRLSVEGLTSGIAFGMLAAATALGSFLTNYSYADEIADYLARTEGACKKAIQAHRKLAADPSIRRRAEALTAAASIKTEHAHRGRAAWWQLHALSQRILRRNPGVAGHGVAAEQPEIIGRRFRGDAA
ncbi:hypothetical protein E1263_05375 [Kribbella antibiotica]|uniref:Uncharacterized protein n=1 Tax=Kribbella antibiotica TaxID=190195 RepID=A0A4R4ZSM3_9ACTN|nr:hypothetical protein [Kribbella antibiotica]TDD62043.1 hypothetical protein E1263_05375 [Kribbella antibiotica]